MLFRVSTIVAVLMAIVATSHVDADMDVSRGLQMKQMKKAKKGKKGGSSKSVKKGKKFRPIPAPTPAPVAGTTVPTISAYPTSAPVPANDNDASF